MNSKTIFWHTSAHWNRGGPFLPKPSLQFSDILVFFMHSHSVCYPPEMLVWLTQSVQNLFKEGKNVGVKMCIALILCTNIYGVVISNFMTRGGRWKFENLTHYLNNDFHRAGCAQSRGWSQGRISGAKSSVLEPPQTAGLIMTWGVSKLDAQISFTLKLCPTPPWRVACSKN